jgi:hypothetical protein
MEREDRDRHDAGTSDVLSTRWTTATLRVRSLTRIASPDPRTRVLPRSKTTVMIWSSPPSPCWHHISDRSPTRQLQAKHPEVRWLLRPKHLVVNLLCLR